MASRHVWMALTIALLIPSQARAQAPATTPSFGDLQRILKIGDWVKVTDENGATTTGRVTGVTTSSLALVERRTATTSKTWTATEKTATRIQRTDSLRNGALIGLAAGAGGLALAFPLAYVGPILANVAAGAIFYGPVVGAVVDRLIGNEVIYRAPSGAKQTKLVVSPLLGRHRAGVSFTVGF